MQVCAKVDGVLATDHRTKHSFDSSVYSLSYFCFNIHLYFTVLCGYKKSIILESFLRFVKNECDIIIWTKTKKM